MPFQNLNLFLSFYSDFGFPLAQCQFSHVSLWCFCIFQVCISLVLLFNSLWSFCVFSQLEIFIHSFIHSLHPTHPCLCALMCSSSSLIPQSLLLHHPSSSFASVLHLCLMVAACCGWCWWWCWCHHRPPPLHSASLAATASTAIFLPFRPAEWRTDGL